MKRSKKTPAVLALVLALGLVVAACASDTSSETTLTEASPTPVAETTTTTSTTVAAVEEPVSSFPITVEHAFGETAISEKPVRVVTWGWSSTDAAIALGVVPVAMPFHSYGGDENGVLPWVREALDEMGVDLPTVLPDAAEIPFEAIAAADPDLILAVYSGITDEEYELLSAIAPTVAYPGEAWATPWRDVIEIVGTSLGLDTEADALLLDIDEQIAEQAAAHPELEGKTVALVWDFGGVFYVYKPADARAEFTFDLGLVNAPSVDELSSGDSTFFFTLSYEVLDQLTSDILVAYADTPEEMEAFLTSDHGKLLPQVRAGTVAQVIGTEFIASVSPPTALSLTWGLETYVALLSAAAKVVEAKG